MLKLYIVSIRRALKSHRVLILFIMMGIIASMLCISLTLGSARNDYEGSLNINYLTTITVSFDTDDVMHKEAFSQIYKKYEKKLLNVICFAEPENDEFIIGWYGYGNTNWFPHVNGRFFSKKEVEKSNNVVYITMDEYSKLANSGNTTFLAIDGVSYEIIGNGFMVPHNFNYPISSESTQTMLLLDETISCKFRIIPYTTFFEKYDATLLLVQFNQSNYADLESITDELKNEFPNASITMPSVSSDNYLLIQKIWRSAIGMVFAIIIGVTIFGIMLEWMKLNRKQYYIFTVCGASKKQIIGLILYEWFVYMLIGTILAVFIHFLSLDLLVAVKAAYLPDFIDMAIYFLIFYVATVLLSAKKISRYVNIMDKEDVS